MTNKKRITVLLDTKIAEGFEEFCQKNSHKKSTLVAHLIEEFLKKNGYPDQTRLF